ncbi:AAA family ATPase [Armatimonas rosea]|uniref:Nuclease SbcCD subunit C n=1 Tax=Armatimonas rosea TaxID=685828 RepID=A0A7W9SPF6_ARMRO|nr:AAA family ATPase [Armatimonas rosea]MBB6050427.1 DNA repair exonuclease SbcCD ATPase subunit [Armatimonas rosea]
MILLHRLEAENFKQFEKIELDFPERGAVLIEGHNEAGKSSLFEAVYFALYGKGLGGLDVGDLKRYHADQMKVTLRFSVEGRQFTVERRLASSQKVTLTCPVGLDGQVEVIKTLTPANKRIIDELGMSDASLLNTCFVEQKRLERIESAKPEERKQTINELLNLKSLSMLESEFKVVRADKDAVLRAKERVDIANLDGLLSALQEKEQRMKTCCQLSRWQEADREHSRIQLRQGEIATEQDKIKTRLREIKAKFDTINRLEARAQAIARQLAPLARAWQDGEHRIAEAEAAVTAAKNAALQATELKENLKQAEMHHKQLVEALEFAKAHRAWEDYHQAQNQQQEALTKIESLKQKVEEAERAEGLAQVALAGAEQKLTLRTALQDWANASENLTKLQSIEMDRARFVQEQEATRTQRMQELEANHTQLTQQLETVRTKNIQELRELEAAHVTAIREWEATVAKTGQELLAAQERMKKGQTSLPIMSLVGVPSWSVMGLGLALTLGGLKVVPLLLIGLVLLLVGVGLAFQKISTARKASEGQAIQLSQEVGRLEQVQKAAKDQRTALEQQQAQHLKMAREQHRILEQGLLQQQAQVLEQKRQAEQKAAGHHGSGQVTALPEAQKQEKECRTTLEHLIGDAPFPTDTDAARTSAEAITHALEPIRTRAREAQEESKRLNHSLIATQSGVKQAPIPTVPQPTDTERQLLAQVQAGLSQAKLPSEPSSLASVIGQLKQKMQGQEELAATLPTCEQAHQAAVLARDQRRDAFHEACQNLLTENVVIPSEVVQVLEVFLPEQEQAVRMALQVFDPSALRIEQDQHREAEASLQQEQGRLRQQESDVTKQREAAQEALATDSAGVTALLQSHPEVTSRTSDFWQAEALGAGENVLENRSRRKALADRLGLTDELLESTVESLALQTAQRALRRKELASKIVEESRKQILDRVMPSTEIWVKKLLPLLTNHRYRDIKWNSEENKVSVLDSRKGEYVEKRVFSGGARDQISLALRLAFALATLPGESATRPGWLFLDEPLSSFDEARTLSLIDLLTKGLIHKQFQQIFLVSHSKSFDPDKFPHRITMEAGRIVSS